MYHLVIVPTRIRDEYSCQLRTSASDTESIVWHTKVAEINLDETIQKILRVTNNLRELPSSTGSSHIFAPNSKAKEQLRNRHRMGDFTHETRHPMDRPEWTTNDFGDPIYIPNDMGK